MSNFETAERSDPQVSGVLDVEARLQEHGLTWKHAAWGLMLRIIQLLETIAWGVQPDNLGTLHDSVTIAAGKTTGFVAFKQDATESWEARRYSYKSIGAHATVCEVFVEGSDPVSIQPNFTNLVDNSPSLTENTADNSQPIVVAPGHHLIFYFTGATAADTISVTVQIARLAVRPHSIFRQRGRKR